MKRAVFILLFQQTWERGGILTLPWDCERLILGTESLMSTVRCQPSPLRCCPAPPRLPLPPQTPHPHPCLLTGSHGPFCSLLHFHPAFPCVLQSESSHLKVKVAHSCPTLCDPMDYTVHGILHSRILEFVSFPFPRGWSQTRNWTGVSCIAGEFFTSWATREVLDLLLSLILSNLFFLNCLICFSVLDLPCLMDFSLVAVGRGYSLVAVSGLLTAVASCCRAQALGWAGFHSCGIWTQVVLAPRLSCSAACGIFLDQGSNPQFQADSLPLSHQGSPSLFLNLSPELLISDTVFSLGGFLKS